MANVNVAAMAIAARVNEVAEVHHAGHVVTANDILNIAQAIATDPDVAVLFEGIVGHYDVISNICKAAASRRARRSDGA